MASNRSSGLSEFKQLLLIDNDVNEIKENRQATLLSALKKKKKTQQCAQFSFRHQFKYGCVIFMIATGSLTASYLSKLRELNQLIDSSYDNWRHKYAYYLNATCPSEYHPFWYHPEKNIFDTKGDITYRFEQLTDYCNTLSFSIET